MNIGLNLKLQFANAGLIAVLSVAGSAAAQTLPKQGGYDFVSCWSGISNVVQFSRTDSVMNYEMTGANHSNPPGGLLDKTTFRCVGLQAWEGGKASGLTVCEMIDQDGDKRISRFSLTIDGKMIPQPNTEGTGKYEDMEMNGSVEALGPFPEVKPGTHQDCNHQTGTYKMK